NVSGFSFLDIGVRKKALKGRLVFNASVRDAFANRIREREAVQPNFTTYNFRLRGRFITFGVSYGFGKGEAREFAGRKRF
ncbi:MAG: outer membrane beta-barrel protein, partial [Bacteroidota bacterium]